MENTTTTKNQAYVIFDREFMVLRIECFDTQIYQHFRSVDLNLKKRWIENEFRNWTPKCETPTTATVSDSLKHSRNQNEIEHNLNTIHTAHTPFRRSYARNRNWCCTVPPDQPTQMPHNESIVIFGAVPDSMVSCSRKNEFPSECWFWCKYKCLLRIYQTLIYVDIVWIVTVCAMSIYMYIQNVYKNSICTMALNLYRWISLGDFVHCIFSSTRGAQCDFTISFLQN